MSIGGLVRSQSQRMPLGLWRALRLLKHEIATRRLHWRGIRKARKYANGSGLRLNIGCGSRFKTGWVNIDLHAGADVSLDLREPLPFANNSCAIVYSEHFLEHLEYPDARRFLAESHRVLQAGGCFSIGVPDTAWPLREYASAGEGQWFSLAKEHWHPECRTKLEHINAHFRQYDESMPEYDYHRFAYDFETIARAFADAGFERIRERQFDPNLDTELRRLGTLYVEAFKPRPAA